MRQAKCSACPTRGWVKPLPRPSQKIGRGRFPTPPLIGPHRAYNGAHGSFGGWCLVPLPRVSCSPLCFCIQRMNCSFGTTIRLSTFSPGKPARIRWTGTHPAPAPRRRKLYITRFRPKGRKLVHSAAPPLPGKTALLGFSGDPAFHVEEQRQIIIIPALNGSGRCSPWNGQMVYIRWSWIGRLLHAWWCTLR